MASSRDAPRRAPVDPARKCALLRHAQPWTGRFHAANLASCAGGKWPVSSCQVPSRRSGAHGRRAADEAAVEHRSHARICRSVGVIRLQECLLSNSTRTAAIVCVLVCVCVVQGWESPEASPGACTYFWGEKQRGSGRKCGSAKCPLPPPLPAYFYLLIFWAFILQSYTFLYKNQLAELM